MIGTYRCVYETPCGWCSKWDKVCDKKIKFQGQRAKVNPVDDFIGTSKVAFENKICQSDLDHEWECTGIGTNGTTYTCKKCYAHKTEPNQYSELTVTL